MIVKWRSKGLNGAYESSCARSTSAQKTPYLVYDCVRWVNGVCVRETWRVQKKGTGCLLLEQEVHDMRDELLFARKDVLCLGVGGPPSKAVHVELHHLVGIQNGSSQVHLWKPALTGQITQWQVLLSEFDIVYVTQKAIKGSALADYLAQQPINDYQPMHLEFLDEDIMTFFKEEVEDEDRDKWIVWFDDVSNALGHGVGAV